MRSSLINLLIVTIIALTASSVNPVTAAVPEYTAVIVKTYPHNTDAFTEGLLYDKGVLYESTGLPQHSFIRKVRLETGEVMQQRNIDAKYFGEGIVIWKDRLIELTWKNQIGFIYDMSSFEPRADFHYQGEGWALTQDGTHLFMSDGTSDVRVLDPDTLKENGRIHVTCNGRTIRNLNELEWVKGEIYGNIWLTSLIVRINPTSGEIVGVIDLTELAASVPKTSADSVLNGIAYDDVGDRLFVTGKLWPTLYQIRLSPRSGGSDSCQSLY